MGHGLAAGEIPRLRIDRPHHAAVPEIQGDDRPRARTGKLPRLENHEISRRNRAIFEQAHRFPHCRHHQIRITVPVPVADGETAADGGQLREVSRFRRLKPPPTVGEEDLGRLPVASRIRRGRRPRRPGNGTVHHQQVGIPVGFEVDEGGSESGPGKAREAEADGCGVVHEDVSPIPIERVRLGPKVGHEEVEIGILIEIPQQDSHAGLRPTLAVQRQSHEETAVLEAPVRELLPEQVGLAVVGDIEIEPAVSGEIVAQDSEGGQPAGEDAGRFGHILEFSVAPVPVERVPFVGEAGRLAKIRFAGSRYALLRRVVHHISPHIQVEVGITVVIAEGGGGGPATSRQPRLRPFEVPVLPEQKDVLAKVREEHIGVAVPIRITDGDPETVGNVPESARRSGVPKAPFRTSDEEPIARMDFALFPVPGKRTGLDEVEIEQPIAVGVKERRPTAHDRRKRKTRHAAGIVDKVHARVPGDIDQARLAGRDSGKKEQDAGNPPEGRQLPSVFGVMVPHMKPPVDPWFQMPE